MICNHKYIKLGYCEYNLPDITESVGDLAYGAIVTCERCLDPKLIQPSDVSTANKMINVERIVNSSGNCEEFIVDR